MTASPGAAPLLLEDLVDQSARPLVESLRKYVRKTRDLEVAERLSLAWEAASAGDSAGASLHLAAAVATESAAGARTRLDAPTAALTAPARRSAVRDPAYAIRQGISGRVTENCHAVGRTLIATDASVTMYNRTDSCCGWAFIATDGHWACQGRRYTGHGAVPGRQAVLISELRAVFLGLSQISGAAEIVTDSTNAVEYLTAWQDGDTGAMPPAYSLRARRSRGAPALVALAEMVSARSAELAFHHVKGHAGHTLNEGADLLASYARRWTRRIGPATENSMTTQCADGARTFLGQWQGERRCG